MPSCLRLHFVAKLLYLFYFNFLQLTFDTGRDELLKKEKLYVDEISFKRINCDLDSNKQKDRVYFVPRGVYHITLNILLLRNRKKKKTKKEAEESDIEKGRSPDWC